ncbi:MAG TPA: enoyl-CoA hydratase/isomerase family protein [Stellaceae bacterium]|nr:enoyl-CoA hydratase/isomerase family protein [Stellaceae bacterium]
MTEPTVLVSRDDRGVTTVTLNRPALHNAFDEALIQTLIETFESVGRDESCRAMVLAGAGKSFSAGGDLNWMRRMADYSYAENLADAGELARLMRTLDRLPKRTVARVHGSVFAGGLGLVACCDIAVAEQGTVFSVSEARLGLVPSVISPYLIRAIGARAARRYFLTAERFSAAEAHRIGLVHEVVPAVVLDVKVEAIVAALLEGGPTSQARSKRLISEVTDRPIEQSVIEITARTIAEARASDEAREGLAAFFEKRKPKWPD